MDPQVAGANLDQLLGEMRKSYSAPMDPTLRKDTVNIASGLINYDLQRPAKNLYPVNTPLRNRLPRVPGNGDKTTHWIAVTGLVGSGYDAIPYVAEGARAGVMNLNTQPLNAPYATLGEEINLTYEAWAGSQGFEDEKARNGIRNLQKTMLKEENSLLGGNFSVQLGTPAAPTVTTAATGGSIAAGTYNVKVVLLTYEGIRNFLAGGGAITAGVSTALGTGVPTQLTVTSPVGEQFIVNGGSSNISAATATAALSGTTNVINASLPAVTGAMAYAWFVDNGAGGASTLQAVTTLNSVKLTSLTTTGQNATAISADRSFNAGGTQGGVAVVTGIDGIIYSAFASNLQSNTARYVNGAYVNLLATGTAGTGTTLSASGRGTVVEIDNMLQSMWDNFQVGPTVMFFNSQQVKDVTNKCLTNASGPILHVYQEPTEGYAGMRAGGMVKYYYNPFAQDGGNFVEIVIHPFLPAGTIVAFAENLPIQYQSSEVPRVAEVHTRRDYYQIDWPPRTRKFESGVYAEETLAVYAPFGVGVIGNIGPG